MSVEQSKANPSGKASSVAKPADFGAADLLIRPGTQQVFRDGHEIRLPKLSFDLLMALVRAAPNTVTQDELMREVWPGLVISPETVTQRVKLLREALGDDSQAPRYVGLVRGRGYRLLVPVTEETRVSNDVAASVQAPPRRPPRFLLPAVALALLATATAWWFSQRLDWAPNGTPDVRLPGAAADRSIAVLPFAALSPEAQENPYFAEGLHDELLTRLAQIDGLRVISRGSVLAYRNTDKSSRSIAAELGVSTVLETSVQQVGERVRLNVQLIDAASDAHLWAQTYDREFSVANVLDIQADIARTIAGELQLELQSPVPNAPASGTTANLDAYREYLEGNHWRRRWIDRSDPRLLLVAEDHLRRAIALDPQFALGQAALARVLAEIHWQHLRPESTGLLQESAEAADRALALAPGLAEAHLARAVYLYYGSRRYAEALDELALAEAAMPGYSEIYFVKANILRRLGDLDAFLSATRRLSELAPRGQSEALMYADALRRQGRLVEARDVYVEFGRRVPGNIEISGGLAVVDYLRTGEPAALRKLVSQYPDDFAWVNWNLALLDGDADAARAALVRMGGDDDLDGDLPPRSLYTAWTELQFGDPAVATAELQRLRTALEAAIGDPRFDNQHNVYSNLGLVNAVLGDRDAAIAAGRGAMELLPLATDRFQGARLLADMAAVCSLVGETVLALEYLEQAVGEPFGPLPHDWQLAPLLAPLRDSQGYRQLVSSQGAGSERWNRRQ